MNRRASELWSAGSLLALILALVLLAGCRGVPVDATQLPPAPVQSGTVASQSIAPAVSTAFPQAAPPQTIPSQTAAGAPAAGPQESPAPASPLSYEVQEYPLPPGSRPHDAAPAPDGTVWFTAQGAGELGRLDPATGQVRRILLGAGSAPHGVIVGPDGAAWVTDGGLNAIVRVDPETEAVQVFPLPSGSGNANLNTAAFDRSGTLWFTGQNGIYGRLAPGRGQVEVVPAPGGRGPYGIAATPDGEIYYASLAGSYLGKIDLQNGAATVLEPPTPGQGARRVWSDSHGRLWVSEWNAGQLARYDPQTGAWQEWRLPGEHPLPYAVYVDENDQVWLSDFGANALLRFDLAGETFEVIKLPSSPANVRQLLGRTGEVWGAESGVDQLVVVRER
jgi:virginiamycin B lyase